MSNGNNNGHHRNGTGNGLVHANSLPCMSCSTSTIMLWASRAVSKSCPRCPQHEPVRSEGDYDTIGIAMCGPSLPCHQWPGTELPTPQPPRDLSVAGFKGAILARSPRRSALTRP